MCDCEQHASTELLQAVKAYMCLDSSDFAAKPVAILSKEDESAICQLRENTVRVGDRFETSLLWKLPNNSMPDSRPMAERRAQCLLAKMRRDPELATILLTKMDDYLAKGYARKLLAEEIPASECWYLPVFPVTNPNKPGKVRLVWDAAAKVNGVSLNTMLLKGPDQLTSLVAIMLRFRQRRIAISADIAEMFHQVRIRQRDQNFQRFLWYERGATAPSTYVMTVMTFGAACSPSCAQYVKNKNAEEHRELYPRAADCVIKNHYVDDMLDSVDTEEEAIQLARDVICVHAKAGFHIRNWISNSSAVVSALNGTPIDGINLDLMHEMSTEKVLGMWWSTGGDYFSFKISARYKGSDILQKNHRPTKRQVLSLIMTIFDPLGLIAYFTMYAKIIFQETWRSGCGWDDPIPDDQYVKWLRWTQLLPEVESIRIPRCYMPYSTEEFSNIELHTFVDASEHGFAAVSYLRYSIADEFHCALVSAKTRVAPLKVLSIPRLELQAALLGARLAENVTESLSISINRHVFWTDSRTVLAWLQCDHRRYKQFVAFRVSEIAEITNVADWRWVPTGDNVADDATKWAKNPNLSSDSRWINGPPFLKLHSSQWPLSTSLHDDVKEELRPAFVGAHGQLSIPAYIAPKYADFSTWTRLLRVTAATIRCAKTWLSAIREVHLQYDSPSSEEFRVAELMLWRQAQADAFGDDIVILSRHRSLTKTSSIYKLSPYLDADQILRLGGRVAMCNGKNPIILPRNHHITELIVNDFHIKYHHGSSETVVNEIRQLYWIPRLRVVVNRIRRRCQLCKNRSAQPRPPQMGPLPPGRLAAFCRPFSYVGVDYFGPLPTTVRRSIMKRYGVLFTCLTTRAVHLEIAYSLSTDSCICSIRNFIARRGSPIELWSDNGTNFKGAEKELQSAFAEVDRNEIVKKFTSAAMTWRFIPPAAPHMGGAWERLVRSVKAVLYRILPLPIPNDEILRTTLMEVEMVINSRPLTYIPIHHEEEEALTPNHFLLGSSSGTKPLAEPLSDGASLRRGWRLSQQLADAFWKRWVSEYIPVITRRSKWFAAVKPLEVGDIVYIVDPNHPRNCWPKGKIIRVKAASDGQVRSAVVQTATGIYERPATKVAALDLVVVNPGQNIPGGSVTESPATPRSANDHNETAE